MICHRRSSDIFIWKYTFNLQNVNNTKPGSRTFHIIFGPFRGLKRTFSAVYTSVCSISNKLNVIFCVREKIFKLPNRASTFTRIPGIRDVSPPNIDFMLKFDDHVTEICKKASKQLAVLKTLGRFLTKQGKLVIYNSFIASNFSYCPLAWHFCSIASTNKLEKVQERALRFINNDYSSSLKKLLSQTKTEPLHVKRLKLMACEVFKIVNKLSPEYIQDMISIKTSTYNFRGERKAEIPRVNTTRYGLRSFRSEAPRIWNSLPNNLRVAESYPQFQGLLRRWDGLGCGCPLCCA